MTVFALLACLALIWLICKVCGAVLVTNPQTVFILTILSAIILSLFLFGRGIIIQTVNVR